MKWLYLVLAIVYLISPYDILPDFLGLPGRLDDIAVLIYIYWKYFRNSDREQPTEQDQNKETQRKTKISKKSAEQILELKSGATKEEIEAQYKRLMSQYHPDKVNHLGPELQKLAHEKSLEIQEAYKELINKK